LTDCIDAFISGAAGLPDTRAEILISCEGFSLNHSNESGSVRIDAGKTSSSSLKFMTLSLTMDVQGTGGIAALGGRFSAMGHSVKIDDRTVVAEPDGVLKVNLEITDASGDFEIIYGDTVSLSGSLYSPWKLGFSYYDVELEAGGKDALASLAGGTLLVEGYDYRTEGLLALFPSIKESNFSFSSKASLSSGPLSFRGGGGKVAESCREAEIAVREIAVDLKRGESLQILLDHLELRIEDDGGNVVEKTIPRLDVLKDLTGTEPEKSWIERNASLLAVIFGAVSLIILAVLVRRLLKARKPPEDKAENEG
ncbi:MAG: hypothetical protein J5494_08050, partial [Candidatus Methanomethylophilaceae archaeon]|nr:hypothetical protein [Candidatus Methanomethylophilaceae archaeon]